MPHIRMRGLPEDAVASLSRTLLAQLAELCRIDAQGFTLDWIPSTSYRDGKVDLSTTQVEVLWFPKDPDTHDKVEQAIRKAITSAYPELQHLAVMFSALDPSTYYRDGKHF
ncbi:DUF1904 domain-containing protein [Shewanella psychropiezotolerans]|uniref:DUF1904 domain-containing protein n=1 Tax=Shewanella psychropiezotolerans TaxID=2593655 RepID=A0ABX5WYD5_9GAMM|nr:MULTISPECIES: DUF1904 domain-containing protein [Shewanella]MPY23801.1 DUF1904 domain-containing protein [Shewanella sp. YLB-07]QDO84110.1 DUF1904 domain-containing protein [Shewanella psychropiezotolerans]